MNLSKKNISYGTIVLLIIIILALLTVVIPAKKKVSGLESALLATQNEYRASTEALTNVIAELQSSLDATLGENAEKDIELQNAIGTLEGVQNRLMSTQEDLRNEEAKIGALTEQVTSISSVVGQIEKLSTTDEELLKKYSKVYFLNEHYIPEDLILIEDGYTLMPGGRYWFQRLAYPHLKEMIIDARLAGHEIYVVSAYRSFYSQGDIKLTYTVSYGEGANTFSADQGYSEHQLGTTVDLTEKSLNTNYERFGETDSYTWLRENAHKYGFVLSYPEGNSYYIFEPWHWRFVGKELATKLYRDGNNFYDVDQRTLDNYLISLFDSI